MPRRPASPSNVTCPEMLMNAVLVVTAGRLANTRTTPPCSTTNQRAGSLGAWSIATGAEKLSAGNTRSTLSCTGGAGGGDPGGGLPPPSPLGQPAASSARAAAIPVQRRRACILRSPSEQAWVMARRPGKLYRGAMSVLASFKARAAALKREVLAIYLAAKHPRTP